MASRLQEIFTREQPRQSSLASIFQEQEGGIVPFGSITEFKAERRKQQKSLEEDMRGEALQRERESFMGVLKSARENPMQATKAFGAGLLEGATLGIVDLYDPDTVMEQRFEQAGDIAGFLVPGIGAWKMVRAGTKLTKTGNRLLKSKKLMDRAMLVGGEEAVAGAAIGLVDDPFDWENNTAQDRIEKALLWGGTGAVFGAAMPFAGAALKKSTKRVGKWLDGRGKLGSRDLELRLSRDKVPAAGKFNPAYASKEQVTIVNGIKKQRGMRQSDYLKLRRTYLDGNFITDVSAQRADEFISILKRVDITDGKVRFANTGSAIGKVDLKTVGITDYFKSPKLAFQKFGVGSWSDEIFDGFTRTREYVSKQKRMLKEAQEATGIGYWGRYVNKKEVRDISERIFDAVDLGKISELKNPNERAAAHKIKALMDDLWDMVNETRKSNNLKPLKKRENYITHLMEENASLVMRELGLTDAPMELMTMLRGNVPTETINNLLKQRKGFTLIKKDAFGAAEAALNMHTKYAHVSPSINRFEKLLGQFDDILDSRTKSFMEKRLKRFAGNPGAMETFLRKADDKLAMFIAGTDARGKRPGIPLLSKKTNEEFRKSFEGVLTVPRITRDTPVLGRLFPSKVLGSIKMLKYWADLSMSVPYYFLNMTQFWQNVPPNLRGNMFKSYGHAAVGYKKMMVDFFNPDMWKHWRKEGVLTEMDELITSQFDAGGSGLIADTMNLFSKGSEFMNRVATVYASDINLAALKKAGKIQELVPEINAIYGGEMRQYSRELARITQFAFGIETKPAAFSNPVADLYHQYNSFSLSQAELIADMLGNVRFKQIIPDLNKAISLARKGNLEGSAKIWQEFSQGQRGEAARYLVNVTGLITAFGAMGGSFLDAIGFGMKPTFIEGANQMMQGIVKGDERQFKQGMVSTFIPPALQPLYRQDIKDALPLKNFVKQAEIAGQLMSDKEQVDMWTDDNRFKEAIDKSDALKEIFFGRGRTSRFEEQIKTTQEIRKLNDLYGRKLKDERGLAKEIVRDYVIGHSRQDAMNNLALLRNEGIVTPRVMDKVKEHLDDMSNEMNMEKSAFKNARSNQVRATFLYYMKTQKSQAEYSEFVIDLAKSGLITKGVMEEFLKIQAEVQAGYEPELVSYDKSWL